MKSNYPSFDLSSRQLIRVVNDNNITFHTDLRKKLQVSVHTDHHIYKDGIISEKEMQSL